MAIRAPGVVLQLNIQVHLEGPMFAPFEGRKLFSSLPSPASFRAVTRRSLAASVAVLLPLALSGCGMGGGANSIAPVATGARGGVSGTIFGGQQPVAGSTISLYAAGKTATGSTPRSMLTAPVLSGADGSFTITGLYSCQAGDQVYLVASGGNAGGGPNAAIAMMAALGPCSTLLANASTTFINVDEVTTVGSVYALAGFMTTAPNVGSDPGTVSTDALAAAFANTKTMVNTTSGTALTTSTGNGVVPQTTINSLANSIAACINTGSANSSGANSCANLFSATTAGGVTPTNTLQAALNVAHTPAQNAAAIFALASSTPPFQPTLTAAPASYAITVTHPSDVLTYHNNNSRTGVQNAETTLTPATVTSANFGKVATFPVDSYLFAQPLYVGGVGMPDGNVHNLLMAVTTHGTLYAFDADGNNPASGSLWSVSLIPGGERYATASDYGCSNPPEAGVVGTPVIDRNTQTIYMVMKTITSTGGTYYQRLHAVSLIDGSERTGSPVLIAPVFTGTGDGTSGGTVTFNAQRQSERSALLLAPNASGGNTVWISFASHCDIGPYHGIIMAYDGSTLANTASFIDTPNGSDGGIWMSNGGMIADAQGFIYTLTGNGSFDANTNGPDYGDAALKLTPPAAGASSNLMSISQYFVPFNQADLNAHDLDVGGAEGILVSDPQSGIAPQVLIASDKNGSVYLLNTAQMDGYDNNGTATNTNGDIQDFTAGGTFIYNFAFFNNMLYTSTPLKAYAYVPGTATTAGSLNTTPVAQNTVTTAPVVSANGLTNGIVWAQDTGGVMHAYTSTNLTELYNTSQATGGRDTPSTFVKFTSPLIANGKVYLSGNGAVVVYGPLH